MTVAACVQCLLARHLTAPAVAAVRFSGTDRLQQPLQRSGWLAVVVLRLIPGPFVALNLAAGLTLLRLRWMAIGTLIGGVPKALGWAALGLGITRLAVSLLVIAAVIVAVVALTAVWLRGAQAAARTGACPTRSRGWPSRSRERKDATGDAAMNPGAARKRRWRSASVRALSVGAKGRSACTHGWR